jgi:DNA-binding SARP family transcriptional activator
VLSSRFPGVTVSGVLEFRILGPIEVADAERPVALGGPKQRATLAILLLNANRVVSVERVADDLYAGAPPITAVNQVQRQVFALRQALGPGAGIETRSPGYLIRLGPEQLDLDRFERLAGGAADALARGAAQQAADWLREALGLWRGAPLADLQYESFAQATIARLEEIRLAALELRIDADLALGRHVALVAELESLVAEHPLRERFQAQLMLALYRSGREAEALEAYRRMRAALVDEFGLEPSSSLQDVQRSILAHDPVLDLERTTVTIVESARRLLLLPSDELSMAKLLAVAEPLALTVGHELLVVRLLAEDADVAEATAGLNSSRAGLMVTSRCAAFTSDDFGRDGVRLASEHDVDLLLLDGPSAGDAALPVATASVLSDSPADVALVAGDPVDWARGSGVFLPFGGGDHDWAALEVAAQLARSTQAPLRLVGTKADATRGRRDASRLLADASLIVQRFAGIEVVPMLAGRSVEELLETVAGASVIVTGLSERWRDEGIGGARRALLRDAGPPVLFVHRGPRPGVLAPRGSRTRFSWTAAF